MTHDCVREIRWETSDEYRAVLGKLELRPGWWLNEMESVFLMEPFVAALIAQERIIRKIERSH